MKKTIFAAFLLIGLFTAGMGVLLWSLAEKPQLHAGQEPHEDNHPIGRQCSECHNTHDWDDADDD